MIKFKKIFRGFDFRNNKIINAKTITPTENEHIVPKEYVDVATTYDTVTSTQQNSPKFPWVQNLQNKSFKQIFDDLFFPVVNPIYVNPTFNSINISVFDEYSISGGRKAIFEDRICKFRVDFTINPSDRISGNIPKIVVTNNSGSISNFNGTTISDVSGYIDFEFLWRDIQSIEFQKNYSVATSQKFDNFGTPYTPPEFLSTYILKFDILNFLSKKYLIYPPILYFKNVSGDFQTILDNISNNDSISTVTNPTLLPFVKDRKFLVDGSDNKFVIAIPEPLYNTGNMIIHINQSNNNIGFDMLFDGYVGSSTGPNIKSLIYFNRNIKYFFGYLDLGKFTEQKTVNLQFNTYKTESNI